MVHGPPDRLAQTSRTTGGISMEEDIKKLCMAVGMSIDRIAKKYGYNQDKLLELFMQTMKQIQQNMKE